MGSSAEFPCLCCWALPWDAPGGRGWIAQALPAVSTEGVCGTGTPGRPEPGIRDRTDGLSVLFLPWLLTMCPTFNELLMSL